jgi:Ca-activated chloride channel family protein
MSYLNRMNQYSKTPRRGSALVLCTMVVFLFAILGAFVINVAYVELTTTQLHVASDAIARAAGRTFIITGSEELAMEAAQSVAQHNLVAKAALQTDDFDLEFGKSIREDLSGRYSFDTAAQANAVQVKARRSQDSGTGPLKLLFTGIFSVEDVAIERTSVSTQVDVDIALVVDRSGSMAYAADEKAVFPPSPKAAPPGWTFGHAVPSNSRWDGLITAVNTFAKELSESPIDTRLAIISYADSATVDQSLTNKILTAPNALNKYTIKFNSGATNIGAGLTSGGNALKKGSSGSREGAIKVIVLMTDGIRTAGSLPVPIAEKLAKDGALIFTITFSDEADKKTMESVAEKGNGKSFHADTAASLENAFVEIVKQLPTLITL